MKPEIHNEYQELIRQSKSCWLSREFDGSESAIAEHVDSHVRHCKECTELMKHQLWERCRQSPLKYGPVRTWLTSRRVLKQLTVEEEYYVEGTPIVRIVNTIIQQAIKKGSHKIRVALKELESADVEAISKLFNEPVNSDSSKPDLMRMMMEDIAKANPWSRRKVGATALRVDYQINSSWVNMHNIPLYIYHPIVMRIKCMAELMVKVTDKPQIGNIQVRYEGKDYDLTVSTYPKADSEEFIIDIAEIDMIHQ